MTVTDDPEAVSPGAFEPRADPPAGGVPAWVALGALVVVVSSGLAIAAGAAAGTRYLSGSPHSFPAWVAGPLAWLGAPSLAPVAFAGLLAVMGAAYAVTLAAHRRIGLGAALAGVAAAHVVFALAPPIVTPDVFSYLAYARLGALHGLSPYLHPPEAVPDDPVLAFVSFRDLPSPYGPLFTVLTYPLASLGLATGLWALKAGTAFLSLACVAAVARLARHRERPVVLSVLLVGLNPLLLVYGVGGAHNDYLLTLLVLLGLLLAAAGREAAAAGALVAATAVKVTGGLVLPFLVAGARTPRRALAGAVLAGAGAAAAFVLVFGLDAPVGLARATGEQSRMVSELSVPYLAGWLIGHGGAGPGVRAVAALTFLAVAAWLLVRTVRGHDWIDATGWATLALLLLTAWPMPYYLAWLVPLAAVGSRALLGATLALCVVVGVSRAALILV